MREGIAPAPVTVPDPGKNFPVSLTDDELQLLAEIATGVTTDVAARRLELSARTLRRRLRAICDQLGVNTPIEAVVWAARKQLI
ncbi:LuxR C-terminal-related transcriptional regulator [Streptomonospora alba]